MRLRAEKPTSTFPEKTDSHAFLDKHDLAESLTNLYASIEDSSVALLHGRWGVGKSTFVERWSSVLEDEGFGVIRFDAFAHDYMGEPFDALITSIIRKAEKEATDSNKLEGLKNRAAAVSKSLAVTGLKAGVRVVTLNAIEATDIEALVGAAKGLSGDLAGAAEVAAKNLLERQASDMAAFETFKKGLADIHELSGASTDEKLRGEGRTVFIVDELDRCRPDFALALLESLKHFFRTDGLHFLLVTNRDFLEETVRGRYGLSEHSEEYLQKFYDFTINFESSPQYERQHASAVYARQSIDTVLSGIPQSDRENVKELASSMVIAFDLTLRQTEHFVTSLSLAYLSLTDGTYSPPMLITMLAFLKANYPKKYAKLKSFNLKYEELEEVIDSGNWPESFDKDHYKSVFQYHLDPDIDLNDQKWHRYGSGIARYNFRSRLDVLPTVANLVVDRFGRT